MKELQKMLDDIEMEVQWTRRLIGKEVLDERVMKAIKEVPRHCFIPDDLRYCAYENGPVPIGSGQTISQPYIVALMSDLLQTKKTDVILEIGTGSGYQAAILSLLVKQVYTVEIIEELALSARDRLKRLNYPNVAVRKGDGYKGWPEHAPYDGIIVTAAAPHIPQPLIDQLREGARMVIPLGSPYGCQVLTVVEKKADRKVVIKEVLDVRFVPLTRERDWEPDENDSSPQT
ncbi:MAG: protein-L-isoaspartate(D-aspartate) O-methyltransferase [Gammaproteobacteria bacterium]